MDTFPIESLRKLLDYISSSFEECETEDKPDHVYNDIRRLEVWEYANRKGFNNN